MQVDSLVHLMNQDDFMFGEMFYFRASKTRWYTISDVNTYWIARCSLLISPVLHLNMVRNKVIAEAGLINLLTNGFISSASMMWVTLSC